jgi:hypothetical protein
MVPPGLCYLVGHSFSGRPVLEPPLSPLKKLLHQKMQQPYRI